MALSHRKKIIIRNALFGLVGLFAAICGIMLVWISTIKLPDFSSFDSRKVMESTKLYDRTGTVVLYDLNSDVRRTRIPYTDMGDNIKRTTVSIEDAAFYQHKGFRPKAFLRAVVANLTSGSFAQGGSTITQQVIKKSLLSDEKTIVRKLKEIVLALKLEQEYTKEEILGIYLNEIPYGGNVYGIAEASRSFFGKEPADLTLAESAYLAAIPNAPTRFSPYGTHRDLLEARKNLVLSRAEELGFISKEEQDQALAEVVVFQPQEPTGIKAPHFVFFIKEYLEEKYGVDSIESGGMKVITTLDWDLQQIAENAVETYTTGEKKIIEKQNAGLVSIDPKTGQILAMVGSRNYFDKDIDGAFNVTTAKRQPGSSFKPYVYATALKLGYTPETMLFDVPTEFNSNCNPYGIAIRGSQSQCYNPQNYDGSFHGPMSIRSALQRSMNIPAVKMLYMVGIKNAIKTAQDMGITTLTEPDRYGLALVLGGGEVKLLEMTSAYGTFGTEGVRHPYSGILRIEDKAGNAIEEWTDEPIEVLPRNTALQMADILSDNVARTPTFGANSALYIPGRQIAVKTGTTNDFKDSWTVGTTPSLAAGVWMGKNDNTSMPVAVNAGPLWNMYMREALKKYPNESFPKPDPDPDYASLPAIMRGYWQGGESFTTDTVSGGLATDMTPEETQQENVITNVHDLLYWVIKDNPRAGRPANPANDPLFNNFETGVRNWWANNSGRYPIITEGQIPDGYDSAHTTVNGPQITVLTPQPNATFSGTSPITVQATSTGTYGLQKIDIYLNNVYVGTAQGSQPSYTFIANQVDSAMAGENILMVVGTDMVYGKGSTTVPLTLTNVN